MAGFPMELSPGSSSDDASTIKSEDVTTFSKDQKTRTFLQPAHTTSIPVVWAIIYLLWCIYCPEIILRMIMRKMKLHFFPSLLQNVMSNLIESPLIQARQILSMSPTSPTNLTVSQASSSSLDQMIMPIHQISQNQKQSILPEAGIFRGAI